MRARLLVAAFASALLLVPAASGDTIRVSWREQVVVEGEHLLRLRVDALAFTRDRWAVRLSFTNTSPRRLAVVEDAFGLALYRPGARDACRYRLVRATSFWPVRPQRFAPGDTWRGVFGGRTALPSRGSVRVVVAWFSGGPRPSRAFGWITDHVYDLGARRGRLAVAPACP